MRKRHLDRRSQQELKRNRMIRTHDPRGHLHSNLGRFCTSASHDSIVRARRGSLRSRGDLCGTRPSWWSRVHPPTSGLIGPAQASYPVETSPEHQLLPSPGDAILHDPRPTRIPFLHRTLPLRPWLWLGRICRPISYVDWWSVRIPLDGVEISATRGESVSISSPIIDLSTGGQGRARWREDIDPWCDTMDPRMDSETMGHTSTSVCSAA